MKLIKKIYTIIILLSNIFHRHKYYTLHFVAETDGPIKRWYYDFKHWGFDKQNLEMVSGADTLCELYANGKDEVTIDIMASRRDLGYISLYDHFKGEEMMKSWDRFLFGRTYKAGNCTYTKGIEKKTFWICPVTLFVLGRYPKHLYIKRHNEH